MLTINGTLALDGDTLNVTKALSGQSADGAGPGTINVGQNAGVSISKTATISNLVVNLAGSNASLQQSDYDYDDCVANGGALTLAANTTIVSTGAQNWINSYNPWNGGGTVNNGVIEVKTGALTIGGGPLVNVGTIDASGGSLTVYAIQDNSGTISASGGAVYLQNNGANTGTIVSRAGLVYLQGTLTQTSSDPSVAGVIEADGGQMVVSGSIIGGTAIGKGAGVAFQSGVLDGVAFYGTIDLTGSWASLSLLNGLAMKGADGTGAGTINVGSNGQIIANNSETISNATIYLAGGGARLIQDTNWDGNQAGADTLTLARDATLVSIGDNAQITSAGYAGTVLNQGEIDVGAGSLTVNPDHFVNAGTIDASGGALNLGASNGDWTNAGIIAVRGATVNLGAGVNVGTIDVGAGALTVQATLTQTASGGVLVADGGEVLVTGAIVGGQVVGKGAGVAFQNGALDGVAFDGTMDLTDNWAAASIRNGVAMAGADGRGAATINIGGSYSALTLFDTQTLANATINLGGNYTSLRQSVDAAGAGGGANTLTLADSVTVVSTGVSAISADNAAAIVNAGEIDVQSGQLTLSAASFVNQGTIDVSGGTLFVDSASNWTNSGVIEASGGAIHLGGTGAGSGLVEAVNGGVVYLEGVMTPDGSDPTGTLRFDSEAGGRIIVTGEIANATVQAQGGGLTMSAGVLDGVHYRGTMDLAPSGSSVNLRNGLSMGGLDGAGAGTVNLGDNSAIVAYNAQTISGAVINLAGSGDGLRLLEDDGVADGALTLAADTKIVASGAGDFIGRGGPWGWWSSVDGGLVNAGEIDVVSGDLTISPTRFVNNGEIDVLGGALSLIYTTQFSNYGTVSIANGQCAVSSVTGTGGFALNDNALLSISGGVDGGTIAFNASTATLELSYGVEIDAAISGFGRGDQIVVDGSITDAIYSAGDGTLKLYNGGGLVETLTLSGASYAFDLFTVTANGWKSVISELANTATLEQYFADKAGFDALSGGFTLVDSAANVSAHLADLDDAAIVAIAIADSAAVTVSVAQLTDAQATLAKLANADHTPYRLQVAGAAADVEAGLSALSANLDHIASIQADAPVSVSVADFDSWRGALDKVSGGFTIADTADHVVADLAALAGDPAIGAIMLTDVGAPALAVTVAQAGAGAAALAKIVTPHTLVVADVGAAVLTLTPEQIANLAGLGLTLVSISDQVVPFSTAQRAALGAAHVLAQEPYSGGVSQTIRYNADASYAEIQCVGIANKAWDATDTVYGAAGKRVTATAAGALVYQKDYNAAGVAIHVLYTSLSGSASETWSNDAGKPIRQIAASGATTVYSYDSNGALTETAQSGVVGQKWDALDTVYGANGKSVTATAGGALVYQRDYDSTGRLVHAAYTSLYGVASETWYGPDGKPAQAVSANGATTVYSYDANGALTETVQSGVVGQKWDTLDTVYGANGKSATATAGGALVYQKDYNAAGGPVHSLYTSLYGTASETWYNDAGMRARQIAANGAVTVYSYDAGNVLIEASVSAIPDQKYDARDAIFVNGAIASETWTTQGALWQTESWDANGVVADLHSYAGGVFQGVSYASVDHVYLAGVKTSDVYLAGDGSTLAREDYSGDGGWTISVGGLVKTKLVNADGTSELVTRGIAGQKYDETDAFYDAAGKARSEAWLSGGVVTAIKNWNADGTVNGVETGARSSVDLFAFDPASTTLGYQENASGAGGVLTLSQGAEHLSFALLGQFSAADFALTPGGAGGVTVSAQNGQAVFLAAAHA